jgi:hypothetical protein
MRREKININKLSPNNGQIDGLPKNPRLIKGEKFDKLCQSIKSLPEMTEVRDLIVFPHGNRFVVIGGNMRYKAYKHLGWKEVSCCILPREISPEKLRAIAMQDNNSMGENDWDLLANEWDAKELDSWGIDVWQYNEEEEAEDDKVGMNQQEEEESEQEYEDGNEQSDGMDYNKIMCEDRIYPTDNDFDIPVLDINKQPRNGLLLPVSAYGADSRQKKGISTYHFYVDDYRFEAIWKDPLKLIKSGCKEVVEPNLSLFDSTPIAYGLQQIYKKRWIARFWQDLGVNVYADLNVSQKFYKYNLMGIPKGYNAFATRGYADRVETLYTEYELAQEISGMEHPNMIVYGGGSIIKKLCQEKQILYVEQFIRKLDGEK